MSTHIFAVDDSAVISSFLQSKRAETTETENYDLRLSVSGGAEVGGKLSLAMTFECKGL